LPLATPLHDGAIAVVDYRCTAGPHDRPYAEVHDAYSVSYVRRGSFGYHTRGQSFELVAGAVLIGRPGDEFMCTHAHHAGGDECLCLRVDPALAAELGDRLWTSRALPPLPMLGVSGELAQAAAASGDRERLTADVYGFLERFAASATGCEPPARNALPRERRRIVQAALWLDAHAGETLDIAGIARSAHMSTFHFLRMFARVIGKTPYQYLLGARLRQAARLLATDASSITAIAATVGFGDLSNFVRTFGRAAGMSPRAYRSFARGLRNNVQAEVAPHS